MGMPTPRFDLLHDAPLVSSFISMWSVGGFDRHLLAAKIALYLAALTKPEWLARS